MKILRTTIIFYISSCFILLFCVLSIAYPRFALGEQTLREQKYLLSEKDFDCEADTCTSFEQKPAFPFS